ncbi:MAG: hypothetical protein EBU08_03690 [Micrococcales bacterium]|nr:hypothetical protein [Micrococcales bacterium]
MKKLVSKNQNIKSQIDWDRIRKQYILAGLNKGNKDSDWILFYGVWTDDKIWQDDAVWDDTPTNPYPN